MRPPVPPEHAYGHAFIVVPADIDELGHANNVVWLRWVNEAAIAHTRAVGIDRAFYAEHGVIWVVRSHAIEYLAPALEGEDLVALTWVEAMRGATSLRRTIFRRGADGRALAHAETLWALIDTATGRPRRVPPEIAGRYGPG